jgi:hypothetical protein
VYVHLVARQGTSDLSRYLGFRVSNELTLVAQTFVPIQPGAEVADIEHLSPDREQAIRLTVPEDARTVLHFPGNSTSEPPTVYRGSVLAVLAGEADPADPTHFTVPYLIDRTPGVIDGWLRRDALELRPREGHAGPQASWVLPATTKVPDPPRR